MTDTVHFHQFKFSPIGVEVCGICEKTKETIVDERLDSIEGAISELNEVMVDLSKNMQIFNLKLIALVDTFLAYAGGMAEDLEAFKKLGEGPANEIQAAASDD